MRKNLEAFKQRTAIIVVASVFVGIATLIASKALIPVPDVEPEQGVLSGIDVVNSGDASGGQAIRFRAQDQSNISKRFFADTASFNKKASVLGFTGGTLNTKYSGNLFDYSGIFGWPNDGLIPNPARQAFDASTRGDFSIQLRNYSIPIYNAAEATTKIRIYQQNEARNIVGYPWERPATYGSLAKGPNGVRLGDEIPWNPAWKRPPGVDGIVAIVDYDSGKAWDIYNFDIDRLGCNAFHNWNYDNGSNMPGLFGGSVPNTNITFDINNPNHKCAQSIAYYENIFTDMGTVSDRGAGFAKLATITRAAEVKAGAIQHALTLTVFNQMFGPECSPNNSLLAAGAGDTCAVFQAPGSKVEHGEVFANNTCGNDQPLSNAATRARTIASGQRFALNVTDAEIETWLDARGYTGAKRNTARIFAVAMREYGFIVAETGCAGRAGIETDGMLNADTRSTWIELGMSDPTPGSCPNLTCYDSPEGYPYDGDELVDSPTIDLLWDGLITKSRLRLVNPD